MRKGIILLGAAMAMVFTSCKDNAAEKIKSENVAQAAERDAAAKNFPVMKWDKVEHDFGTINEGDKVETVFKFTNTGTAPLKIVSAKGSCGCTVPQPPTEAILPGESNEIKVQFNSANKPGNQQKTITVIANTETGREIVRIKAQVTPDPEKQKQRDELAAKRKAQQAASATNTNTTTGHEGHDHN
ncbi:DUF1573 domain-containing protein [Sungkyunkwania multivorans]|uniref:DUF1573 domain-containing protein n=1 Tax=Sungkyunkwania multivorans TaxID=1173618 RepID=A0ABW3D498_9FLAO